MKKITGWMVVMLLGLFLSVPAVYADSVAVGDWAKLYDVSGQGSTRGGEFAFWQSDSKDGSYSYSFNTFCLELDEELSYNTGYFVSDISKTSWLGGINTDSGDPLDIKTAYLYYHFRMGDLGALTGGVYSATGNTGANDLQRAIWFIEEEGYATNYLVSLANTNATSADLAKVNVINLVTVYATGAVKNRQSVLDLAQVPEPISVILLGLGMIGIAGLRRKFRV